MSPRDRALWDAVQRRAVRLSPSVGLALLAAYAEIRNASSDADIERALEHGGIEALVGELLRQVVLATAFQPVRERLRRVLIDAARTSIRQVPVPPSVTPRQLAVAFDTLNPRVITAIRALESRVITELTTDIRETVRAYVENGLREGLSPRAIARDLRSMIGVPPSREEWIANYRAALRGGRNGVPSTKALGYELRDGRFDLTVKSAIRRGVPLTAAQEEKMVAAMRRRTVAYSAETVARTATLDALKLGQRLSWLASADAGFVERTRVRRRWTGVMDSKERPTHKQMEGETIGLDGTYSNGQTIPGDDEYGCRCIERYFLAAA